MRGDSLCDLAELVFQAPSGFRSDLYLKLVVVIAGEGASDGTSAFLVARFNELLRGHGVDSVTVEFPGS